MHEINWDYERGHRDGYVRGSLRFSVHYHEADEVGEEGRWSARDLLTEREYSGTHEGCLVWCEDQLK